MAQKVLDIFKKCCIIYTQYKTIEHKRRHNGNARRRKY